MADSNAVRQENKRKRDAAKRVLHGAQDYELKFESYRGTTAAIERLIAKRGLDHKEAVNELITLLIHEADEAL